MTKSPDGANSGQNNFRFGAGIVLGLGGKELSARTLKHQSVPKRSVYRMTPKESRDLRGPTMPTLPINI